MVLGSELRFSRLFNSKSRRSFMIAMDHGMLLGAIPGLEAPLHLVPRVLEAAPDAIVMSPGLLTRAGSHLRFRGAPSPVVRLDFVTAHQRLQDGGDGHEVVCSPAEALRLGAEAVMVFLVVGTDARSFSRNLAAVGRVTNEAHALGLPVIAEVVPWGSRAQGTVEPELLGMGCRIAAEIGVDAVKTVHPGTADAVRMLVSETPAPLLALGGDRVGSPLELENLTRSVVAGGAAGVIYGRNIWQSSDLVGVSARVRALVHPPG